MFSQERTLWLLLITLIGELLVLLLQLKTKVHADHAGLSQLFQLLKEITSLRLDHLFHFLNKNLQIVLSYLIMIVMVVMVDGWMLHSNMLLIMVLLLVQLIPILVRMVFVNRMSNQDILLLHSLMSQNKVNLLQLLLLLKNPFRNKK